MWNEMNRFVSKCAPGTVARSLRSGRLLRPFPEGTLDGDQSVAEFEQVAAFGLDAPAFGVRAREHPFGDAALAGDGVAAVAPVRVGKVLNTASNAARTASRPTKRVPWMSGPPAASNTQSSVINPSTHWRRAG